MDKRFADKVLAYIQAEGMLTSGDSALVALSGGADSMALLAVLLELREPLSLSHIGAAHIHHGLRGEEADRDEAAVCAFCEARGVPLYLHHADVAALAKEWHMGLEEAGRQVRYTFLEETAAAHGFSRIATAHTQSDLVETVLLHITRGCGVAGLQGIPPVRGNIVRPLLDCTREEIEAYCAAKALPYVTDSTNSDTQFARNRIRNCIVPELYNINPRVSAAFARLSSAARADEAYLQQQATQAVNAAQVEKGVFSASDLKNLHSAVRVRAIQRILLDTADTVAEEWHLREIEQILQSSGAVTLPGGAVASVKQNYFIVEISPEPPCTSPAPLVSGQIYRFGERAYACEIVDRKIFDKTQKVHKILLQFTCDYDKIKGTAQVRTRRAGDAYVPFRRGGRKTLKKWFNEECIPAALRDCVPVIADEEGIVLVPGLGCDERTAIDEGTKRVLTFVLKEEE